MAYLKPSRYYKNIYLIDYTKLKEEGIKCLIFDLDNTLGKMNNLSCPEETKKLLKNLQKDFLMNYPEDSSKEYLWQEHLP